jgi:hypothetical protein
MKIAIFILLSAILLANAKTNVTLATSGSLSSSYAVPTGHVAKVTSAFIQSVAAMRISVGGFNFDYVNFPGTVDANGRLPVIVNGPATITLIGNGSPGKAFCTIEVESPSDSFLPSNAVVVPSDAGGPVNVILESSTDLITWMAALPGTYGANTTNRFFRVRAVRAQ